MCKASRTAAVLLLWTFAVDVTAAKMLGVREASVTVDGPVIVGYFPRVSEEDMNNHSSGASEGFAHVGFAVEDTLKCLKAAGVKARAQLEMSSVLAVKHGGKIEKIKLPTAWPEAAGVYFFNPGKPPHRVAAQSGPSSLIMLAPEAAAAYFRAPACRTL
jgi:hypothetical protein